MKLFFYGPKTTNSSLRDGYETIVKTLKTAGMDVLVQTDVVPIRGGQDVGAGASAPTFDRIHGLVVEGSTATPEVGYFLARGLAGKKPTLYLYRKGSGGERILEFLQRKPEPYTLITRAYTPSTVAEEVQHFMEHLEGGAVREVPSIKFTLRITPSIERYLHYKTHNTKVSKADFLREYLEELMKKDEEYLRYLRKQRGA